MDEQILIKKITIAINNFINNESFLLENDLNERTITHKLAIYIEKEFSDYDVDCEYNKIWDYNIDEKFTPKELILPKKKITLNDTKGSIVYPDIIVHKRWDRNNKNLLIIELKKNKYANKIFTYKPKKITHKEFDLMKIVAYMDELNYQYWLYLEFNQIHYNWNVYIKGKNQFYNI